MINFSIAELQYIKELMIEDRLKIIKNRTARMSAEERIKVVKDLFKVLKYPDGTYILPLESEAQWNSLIVDRIEQEMKRITDKFRRET